MKEFIENTIEFYYTLEGIEFIRIFWIFFIFEFTRYLLLDYLVLIIYYVDKWIHQPSRNRAFERFWYERPFISIVVPGKNEGKNFYKLTRTLAEQTYRNYELIVVDDGSDDETPTIGRNLEKRGFIDKFFRNDLRGGKASGANLAIRFARGQFVVHMDADTSLNNDALEKIMMPFYYDELIAGVGGNLKVRNINDSFATAMQSIEYLKTISVGRVITSYLGIYRIISGAFGAFRKDALERVEGYDIGPGLDGDITVKLRKLGYKISFEPEAIAQTHVPDNFFKLAKQRLRWSKSLVRFRMRKHVDVYYPNRNFSLLNFFSFLENFLYNFVFNLAWFAYVFDIVTSFPKQAPYIIAINYLLYVASNFFQLLAIGLFDRNPQEKFPLMAYLPLVPIYVGVYLRLVRSTAYLQELVYKKSYEDPWNPPKTSKHAKEMKI